MAKQPHDKILGPSMKKRKPRKCRICKKRPVWIGGDVKNPGPVCKRCYHKNVWPERMSRRKQKGAGPISVPSDEFDVLFDDYELMIEDHGVPLDADGMPLAWSSNADYYWACIVVDEDDEMLLPWMWVDE
jgi:hypothetical protein